MPVILCVIIAAALALIVGVVTRYLTITNLKNNAESKIGNAEAKAREIIDDAVKTAETTKKEALLEVKEESLKTKNELDKETKERRAELQRYERRVLSKEENLDKKAEAILPSGLIILAVFAAFWLVTAIAFILIHINAPPLPS